MCMHDLEDQAGSDCALFLVYNFSRGPRSQEIFSTL